LADWQLVPYEDVTIASTWTAVAQVAYQRPTDRRGQWQQAGPTLLASAHLQRTGPPIKVVKQEGSNFTRAQAHPGHAPNHGVVPSPGGRLQIERINESGQLFVGETSR
jgi:hypothetical protein